MYALLADDRVLSSLFAMRRARSRTENGMQIVGMDVWTEVAGFVPTDWASLMEARPATIHALSILGRVCQRLRLHYGLVWWRRPSPSHHVRCWHGTDPARHVGCWLGPSQPPLSPPVGPPSLPPCSLGPGDRPDRWHPIASVILTGNRRCSQSPQSWSCVCVRG